jgi:hypothetical protein
MAKQEVVDQAQMEDNNKSPRELLLIDMLVPV